MSNPATDDDDEYNLGEDEEEGQDDEATLDEEERLENEVEIADELAALKQEQDMPIEYLLKMYGCEAANSASIQNSSLASDQTPDLSGSFEKSDETWGQNSSIHGDTLAGENDLHLLARSSSELDVFDETDDVDYEPDLSGYWHKVIRIGPEYQAEISEKFPDHTDHVSNSLIVFDPGRLEENLIVKYLDHFYCRVTGAQKTSNLNQKRLRDDEVALTHLHASGYDPQGALGSMDSKSYKNRLKHDTPTYGWIPTELDTFEQSLKKFGKDFNAVKNNLKNKSVQDVVKLYYFWKFSPMYSRFAASLEIEHANYLQKIVHLQQGGIVEPQHASMFTPSLHADSPSHASSTSHAPSGKIDQWPSDSMSVHPSSNAAFQLHASAPAAFANKSTEELASNQATTAPIGQLPVDHAPSLPVDQSNVFVAPPPVYRVVHRDGRLKIRWLSTHQLPPHSIEESDTHRRQFSTTSGSSQNNCDGESATEGGAYFEQPMADEHATLGSNVGGRGLFFNEYLGDQGKVGGVSTAEFYVFPMPNDSAHAKQNPTKA